VKATTSSATPAAAATGTVAGRTAWASLLLWAMILGAWLYPLYLFPIHNPNERVRIYMTVAMWEHDTFAIGHRQQRTPGSGFIDKGSVYDRWGYVNDKALVCDDPTLKPPDCAGTLYSAKAPGTSFLAYPFYALYASVADILERQPSMDGIILYLRLMVVVIPSLLMLVALRRFGMAMKYDPVLVDLAVAGVALGSMVLTYSHMLAGHQISTYLLFLAFLAAWKRRAVASGFLASMAVCVEYPMALVSAVVYVYLVWSGQRVRSTLYFALGALIPAALTAWYHYEAFGSPLATPYSFLENPQFIKDIAPGVMGLRTPRLENMYGAFVAPFEGMFFFAPWLALCVPALLRLRGLRAGSPDGGAAFLACLASALMLTLFIACHSLWRGGWTLGPRYIAPFVPFAAVMILDWLNRVGGRHPIAARTLLAVPVVASVAVTGSSSLVSQGFHTAFYNPLTEAVLPLLRDGYVTWNLGNLAGLSGGWSAAPLVALTAVGLGALILDFRLLLARRVFLVIVTLLVSVVMVRGLMLPQKPLTPARIKALAFAKENFYPFGKTNADLDERKFRREAARFLPSQQSVLALHMGWATADADCKEAFSSFSRYSNAALHTSAHQAWAALLSAVKPLPSPAPIPLLLRPDFKNRSIGR